MGEYLGRYFGGTASLEATGIRYIPQMYSPFSDKMRNLLGVNFMSKKQT